MYSNRWQTRNQKILFIPLWFHSGYIRCKWKPDHRMDGFGNKKPFRASAVAFFFFWEWVWWTASPVCVQWVRFEMLQRLQRSMLQTIIWRTWKMSLFTPEQRHAKNGEKKGMNLHTSTQRSAVSARSSSPSTLIAAPGSCCWALGMDSHGAAVVMSQMRSALTWAWTHRLEWSCSLSCRRQTIVGADSSTSLLGSKRECPPLTSTLTQTLNRRACAWVKSRMLAGGWYG